MGFYWNARSAILCTIFLQAIVVAIVLYRRGILSGNSSDKILAVLIGCMGLSLTDFMIGFMGFYDKFPWLTFFPFENLFAVIALLYLFSQSVLQSDAPSRQIIFRHLALPCVYFVVHFCIFLLPATQKEAVLANYYFPFFAYIETLFLYIFSTYYIIYIFNLMDRHSLISTHFYSYIQPSLVNWLRYFVIGFAVYIFIDFACNVAAVAFQFNFEEQYYKYVFRAGLTCFLCIAGVNFRENVRLPNQVFEEVIQKNNAISQPGRVSDMALQQIKTKLNDCFEKEKPYLDPELTLGQLAEKLNVSANTLSYLINAVEGRNFNDFVNGYRVQELIEKMKDPANSNFTLLSLAFDSGFNSKTTFNRVFKKITQKTPKAFLEELGINPENQ
jgi:AraC-like DNA-binding protein